MLTFAGLFVLWLFSHGCTTSRSGAPSRSSGYRCWGNWQFTGGLAMPFSQFLIQAGCSSRSPCTCPWH
jgi:hypothetical protein